MRQSQHARGLTLGVEQSDSLLVEGDDGLPTEAFSLVGEDAINKVAAGIESREACFHRRPVHFNVGGSEQHLDGG